MALAIACSSTKGAPPAVAPPTKPTDAQEARADQLLTGPDWYRHAIVYEAKTGKLQWQERCGDDVLHMSIVPDRRPAH